MLEEFAGREFGISGEMLPVRRGDRPPPQPDPPFRFEPPEWAGMPALGPPPASEPPDPSLLGAAALAELKRRNGDEGEPRFVPGPPVAYPSMERPRFPAPQWRQEQLERAKRGEHALDEEEPRRPSHPPRREQP